MARHTIGDRMGHREFSSESSGETTLWPLSSWISGVHNYKTIIFNRTGCAISLSKPKKIYKGITRNKEKFLFLRVEPSIHTNTNNLEVGICSFRLLSSMDGCKAV